MSSREHRARPHSVRERHLGHYGRAAVLGVLGVFLLLGASPGLIAQEQNWIGYVAHVEGSWQIRQEPVELGQRIARSDTLNVELPTPSVTPSLSIVLNGGDRVRFLCDVEPICERPLVPADSLPEAPSVPERALQIVRAVGEIFRGQPRRDVTPLSRGEAGHAREVVLEKADHRINVSPLFARLPIGTYRVALRPVEQLACGDSTSVTTIVEWRDDSPNGPWIEGPAVSSGLHYAIISDTYSPSGSNHEAWVLIASGKQYTASREQLADASAIVESWGEDVPDVERRTFLNAYLTHVAQQLPCAKKK